MKIFYFSLLLPKCRGVELTEATLAIDIGPIRVVVRSCIAVE
jgi:hypothetical protein